VAMRVGIACDLEVRQWEIEQEFKNTRNWQMTKPFETKILAQEWLKEKSTAKKWKTVADGKNPKRPREPWYGFAFEHDGPKK
jgi:hypothetical protein